MQVICVISVIVFVVIALAIFLLFHFIIFRYFFWKSAVQLVMKIALTVAVKKCRNRECDYMFEKKKKDWERVKKRGVISLTHEREKREYRVGIYVVEIH